MFKTYEGPGYAGQTIGAIVVSVFNELEASGKEITPGSIEEALKIELGRFKLPS